jgi:hypothetical protein
MAPFALQRSTDHDWSGFYQKIGNVGFSPAVEALTTQTSSSMKCFCRTK